MTSVLSNVSVCRMAYGGAELQYKLQYEMQYKFPYAIRMASCGTELTKVWRIVFLIS
jgi:hypothetical protein